MIRSLCRATVLSAACLSFPVAAQAPAADVHHEATQRVLLAAWISRVEDELGKQLAFQRMAGRGAGTGVVRVKFNCSEDGHTDKVEVARTSGSRMLDLAAANAVKRIAVMHPLASGMKTDQVYYADIVFASGEDRAYQRQMKSQQEAARNANRWFKSPDDHTIASR